MDPGPLPAALGPSDGYARPFAHRNTGSLVPAASPACRSAVSPPQSQPLYDSNGQRSPELKYPPLSARCLPMENRRNGELGICATLTGARRPDRHCLVGQTPKPLCQLCNYKCKELKKLNFGLRVQFLLTLNLLKDGKQTL